MFPQTALTETFFLSGGDWSVDFTDSQGLWRLPDMPEKEGPSSH